MLGKEENIMYEYEFQFKRNGEKEVYITVAYNKREAWEDFHEFLEFEIEAKLHKVEKFD
jgi:hypothetical protein